MKKNLPIIYVSETISGSFVAYSKSFKNQYFAKTKEDVIARALINNPTLEECEIQESVSKNVINNIIDNLWLLRDCAKDEIIPTNIFDGDLEELSQRIYENIQYLRHAVMKEDIPYADEK